MIRSSLSVVAKLPAVVIFKCRFLVEFSSYPTRLAYLWGSLVSIIFHPSPTTQVSAPSSEVKMCIPSVVRYRANLSDGSLHWTSRVCSFPVWFSSFASKRTVCAIVILQRASSYLPKSFTVLNTFIASNTRGESLSGSSSGPVSSDPMSETPPVFGHRNCRHRFVVPYLLGHCSRHIVLEWR
jgi:hypothetical protein